MFGGKDFVNRMKAIDRKILSYGAMLGNAKGTYAESLVIDEVKHYAGKIPELVNELYEKNPVFREFLEGDEEYYLTSTVSHVMSNLPDMEGSENPEEIRENMAYMERIVGKIPRNPKLRDQLHVATLASEIDVDKDRYRKMVEFHKGETLWPEDG